MPIMKHIIMYVNYLDQPRRWSLICIHDDRVPTCCTTKTGPLPQQRPVLYCNANIFVSPNIIYVPNPIYLFYLDLCRLVVCYDLWSTYYVPNSTSDIVLIDGIRVHHITEHRTPRAIIYISMYIVYSSKLDHSNLQYSLLLYSRILPRSMYQLYQLPLPAQMNWHIFFYRTNTTIICSTI